jgi:hypothetical protein
MHEERGLQNIYVKIEASENIWKIQKQREKGFTINVNVRVE